MTHTDLAVVETSAETDTPAQAAVTFVDKAYKARTLVLPDRRAFAVTRSRITTSDPALLEYLERHPDFTREG